MLGCCICSFYMSAEQTLINQIYNCVKLDGFHTASLSPSQVNKALSLLPDNILRVFKKGTDT